MELDEKNLKLQTMWDIKDQFWKEKKLEDQSITNTKFKRLPNPFYLLFSKFKIKIISFLNTLKYS
jgi:hypothetical protein